MSPEHSSQYVYIRLRMFFFCY